MATLYDQQGATKHSKNPVFFATMTYNRDTQDIFDVVSILINIVWVQIDSQSYCFQA